MAEWLGTALQKLLQRFESASDLQERLTFLSVVFLFCGVGEGGAESMTPMSHVMQPPCASPLWLPPTRHSKLSRHPCFRTLLTLKEGCGDSCVDGSLGSPIVVSPRVRAKALTSNLASDLWKRLTFLSVVFVFLWYAGWRGVDDSHVARDATTVCKPPVVAFPAAQQADAPPSLFRLTHLIIYSSYRFTHTFWVCGLAVSFFFVPL